MEPWSREKKTPATGAQAVVEKLHPGRVVGGFMKRLTVYALRVLEVARAAAW